jgi:hypothetical protein
MKKQSLERVMGFVNMAARFYQFPHRGFALG